MVAAGPSNVVLPFVAVAGASAGGFTAGIEAGAYAARSARTPPAAPERSSRRPAFRFLSRPWTIR